MKIFLPLIALAVSLPFGSPNDQAGREPKPVAIFDGRTFDGWEGDLKIFRIEEGAIELLAADHVLERPARLRRRHRGSLAGLAGPS